MSVATPPLHWSVVQAHVQDMLSEKIRSLETISADRLSYVQGEIATLRAVLTMPESIARDVDLRNQAEETAGTPAY